MKKTITFAIGLIALLGCVAAFGLRWEHAPGVPVIQQKSWPAGLADLLNSGGRMYGTGFNEYDNFYFSGDTEDFSRFLDGYAKLEGRSLKLLLLPGQGKTDTFEKKPILFDWQIGTWKLCLRLYIGGQVELGKIKFPANVKVEPDGLLEKLLADIKAKRKGAKPGSAGSSETAQAVDPVVPRSKKPLYAKVALNEDGSKVLSLLYDESEGAGKGYDILYGDVNFNGKFEQSERTKKTHHPAEFRTGLLPQGWEGWAFSPITLNVPFNEKGEGVSDPCKITFRYQRYPITVHIRRTASGTKEREFIEVFEVLSEIRLRQDSTVWDYSFEGNMKPSKTLESALVWSLKVSPRLEITTRSDGRKKGNLGIALNVPAGEKRFECKKAGQPPKAHVQIKKLDGTVVHNGDETLDKFRFG